MELPYANPKWAQYCVFSAPFRFICCREATSRIIEYCVPAGPTARPAFWGDPACEPCFLSRL